MDYGGYPTIADRRTALNQVMSSRRVIISPTTRESTRKKCTAINSKAERRESKASAASFRAFGHEKSQKCTKNVSLFARAVVISAHSDYPFSLLPSPFSSAQ